MFRWVGYKTDKGDALHLSKVRTGNFLYKVNENESYWKEIGDLRK